LKHTGICSAIIADINKSADNADAIVVVTEWEDYKNLNWRKLSDLLRKLLGFLIQEE